MKRQSLLVLVVAVVFAVAPWASADMSGGSIVSWGWDHYGQISNTPTGSGFVDITAGYGTSHALTPVPTPGAVVLGCIGLSFSGWRLRRMKRCNVEVS